METQAQNTAYTSLAKYYDRLMTGKKYEAWEFLISQTIKEMDIHGLALDLACGTGRITEILKKLGLEAQGLDSSDNMLAEARKKYPNARFYQADLRAFEIAWLLGKADFATCFYDSLNYLLTVSDLSKVFTRTSAHLKSGGLFLFDMNTREHIKASQKNKPRTYEDDDLRAVFCSGGEGDIWQLDINLYVKEDDKSYTKSTERHLERGYNTEDIKPLLDCTGFEVVWVKTENKTYEDGVERPSRQYFLAKKL